VSSLAESTTHSWGCETQLFDNVKVFADVVIMMRLGSASSPGLQCSCWFAIKTWDTTIAVMPTALGPSAIHSKGIVPLRQQFCTRAWTVLPMYWVDQQHVYENASSMT
jgi:hypothetical protein